MAKRKERNILCFIGRMNVGKSSCLNVLSGQKNYAIVDSSPGTTADTVTTIMEIHGIGPCKILDTAGVDEKSYLGEKKRKKVYEAIEEADCCILVIDVMKSAKTQDVQIEKDLIKKAKLCSKQILILYNLFSDVSINEKEAMKCKNTVNQLLKNTFPNIVINASDLSEQKKLAEFIRTSFEYESRNIDLLPNLENKGYVILIVPMDEETPTLRLLRPQDMAVERILRNFAIPVLFRMNLTKARSDDPDEVVSEKERYDHLLNHLAKSDEGIQLVITDSQAFDIVTNWTPEKIQLTSFSIMMTNYMSFGDLEFFMNGVRTLNTLKPHDRVLIVEACNHSRKCEDIGTVQIPHLMQKHVEGELNFDFSFGRTYPDDISMYKLIVHCGACMIDRQKYARRIKMAKKMNVPFTNYGILLSFLRGKHTLQRAVQPFLTHASPTFTVKSPSTRA